MGQKALDGMDACAALGAAFASGCAPEGAAIEPHAAPHIPNAVQRCDPHVEAVLTAIMQRISQTFGRER